MSDKKIAQRAQNKCYCGKQKYAVADFCPSCTRERNARNRRRKKWDQQENRRMNQYRPYQIIHDPSPYGFKKGARFNKKDIKYMVQHYHISHQATVKNLVTDKVMRVTDV